MNNFFVVHHSGTWKVRSLGNYSEPFPSEIAALEHAVQLAKQSGEQGYAAMVHFQRSPADPPRIVWTYGKDPDSPLWAKVLRRH
jgi:hypothetical protein